MPTIWRSAVVGLGNIGFLFNLDPKRKGTWSHVTAYTRCDRTSLVGAVEIDKEKIDLFHKQYPDVPVYITVNDLMKNSSPDIVSVCTPAGSHFPIVRNILNHRVKAIFCEKPLAETVNDAMELAAECRARGITLAVNHTRRWESNYLYARELIDQGRIGQVKVVNVLYPAQVFNIGTHIFDVVRMLIRQDVTMVCAVPPGSDDPDPNMSGWLLFSNKIPCGVLATGKREDLIFEIDIVGSEGRLRIIENGEVVELYRFEESNRYSGYRELARLDPGEIEKTDRFVAAIDDIVAVLDGAKDDVNCTGCDGLAAIQIATALCDSAKNFGRPLAAGM